jgi:hypothetical protein
MSPTTTTSVTAAACEAPRDAENSAPAPAPALLPRDQAVDFFMRNQPNKPKSVYLLFKEYYSKYCKMTGHDDASRYPTSRFFQDAFKRVKKTPVQEYGTENRSPSMQCKILAEQNYRANMELWKGQVYDWCRDFDEGCASYLTYLMQEASPNNVGPLQAALERVYTLSATSDWDPRVPRFHDAVVAEAQQCLQVMQPVDVALAHKIRGYNDEVLLEFVRHHIKAVNGYNKQQLAQAEVHSLQEAMRVQFHAHHKEISSIAKDTLEDVIKVVQSKMTMGDYTMETFPADGVTIRHYRTGVTPSVFQLAFGESKMAVIPSHKIATREVKETSKLVCNDVFVSLITSNCLFATAKYHLDPRH